MSSEQGELFSLLLRLHPTEAGRLSLSAGNQLQAAFLDIVRKSDPALAERLHVPNQRRPYTLGLLQGFNHLTSSRLAEMMSKNQMIDVMPGQVYWLRITMLDATIFNAFVQHLIVNPRLLTFRIGAVPFEMSRLLTTSDPQQKEASWIAHSSFTELHQLRPAQKLYRFEFATPTAFSRGQKAWGKLLKLFPEPGDVFESLARQWENFAPTQLCLSEHGLTSDDITAWCTENMLITFYKLETNYLPSSKFGQTGFFGEVVYEAKGSLSASEARWLTTLARFALFSGVGYKTAMGMGQARCINLEASEGAQGAGEKEVRE